MARELNLTVKRGCTLISPKFFSINEALPPNITYQEILQGIDEGTYTLKSLLNKEYIGQVREGANRTVLADLHFIIEDNMMHFKVNTTQFPNTKADLFYDVFEKDLATQEVLEKVHGRLTINSAITKED